VGSASQIVPAPNPEGRNLGLCLQTTAVHRWLSEVDVGASEPERLLAFIILLTLSLIFSDTEAAHEQPVGPAETSECISAGGKARPFFRVTLSFMQISKLRTVAEAAKAGRGGDLLELN